MDGWVDSNRNGSFHFLPTDGSNGRNSKGWRCGRPVRASPDGAKKPETIWQIWRISRASRRGSVLLWASSTPISSAGPFPHRQEASPAVVKITACTMWCVVRDKLLSLFCDPPAVGVLFFHGRFQDRPLGSLFRRLLQAPGSAAKAHP